MSDIEPKKAVLVRLPLSLHQMLVQRSGQETSKRGVPVSVQKLIVERLEADLLPKGSKHHG